MMTTSTTATVSRGSGSPVVTCTLQRAASTGTVKAVPRAVSNGNGVHTATQAPVSIGSLVEDRVAYSPEQVFNCPEESLFYSQCLQKVLGGNLMATSPICNESGPPIVVEFGAGDGSPVIDALLKVGKQFRGRVHGFELNPMAANLARQRCNMLGLNNVYKVHHSCFFKGAESLKRDSAWLVANPPYIPAPDNKILMPELHGGVDGATLTNELLGLGYPNAMLLVSSYSNPLGTLNHARSLGYIVSDFMVCPLQFGYYSSEPKVKNWIREMKTRGEAFFSERRTTATSGDSDGTGSNATGWYLLAGVLFQKLPAHSAADLQAARELDATDELIRVLTAL
ncbi:hypothetical protein V8C86DRAFT_3028720 [Haematococcus lacustris]